MNGAALLQRLVDSDRAVRDDAFDEIAASHDPSLLPLLVEAASPDEPITETALCRYLGNMVVGVALPPLRGLFDSAIPATRRHAMETLGRFDVEHRLALLIDLLEVEHDDVLLYATRELGLHRRTIAIPGLLRLSATDDPQVADAALRALGQIDHPRAARAVRPLLRDGAAHRRAAAVEALGQMETFRRWRRLLPALDDSDRLVRLAAVRTLSQRGGRRARRHLLSRLGQEQDPEVLKLLFARLAAAPDADIAAALIPLAAAHADPQIRRAAGWVVEEFEDAVLQAGCERCLQDGDDDVRAYVLTRMGARQMPTAGALLADSLGATETPRVRYAALEGLGFLRDRRWLGLVEPLLDSDDPMLAYLATLTVVQLVDNVSDCPALIGVLRAPGDEKSALKQVVLQYMIDGITWRFDDSLFLLLLELLRSDNENVRYLSAILLGEGRGRTELMPSLLELSLREPPGEVRSAATESLDAVLDGDLGPLFDAIESSTEVAGLLPQLRWGAASVDRGIPVIDASVRDGSLSAEQCRAVAQAIVGADVERVRQAVRGGALSPPFAAALNAARLEHLDDLGRPGARDEWMELLDNGGEELLPRVAARAVEQRPTWAAEPLLRRAVRVGSHPAGQDLRAAVRVLMDL